MGLAPGVRPVICRRRRLYDSGQRRIESHPGDHNRRPGHCVDLADPGCRDLGRPPAAPGHPGQGAGLGQRSHADRVDPGGWGRGNCRDYGRRGLDRPAEYLGLAHLSYEPCGSLGPRGIFAPVRHGDRETDFHEPGGGDRNAAGICPGLGRSIGELRRVVRDACFDSGRHPSGQGPRRWSSRSAVLGRVC